MPQPRDMYAGDISCNGALLLWLAFQCQLKQLMSVRAYYCDKLSLASWLTVKIHA